MSRPIISLIGGALLAIIAVILVNQRLSAGQTPTIIAAPATSTKPAMAMTTIVVATRDLAYGEDLAPNALREAPWPKAYVPAGAFETLDDIFSAAEDPSVLRAIVANEPVLATKVAGFGDAETLSRRIDLDKRAFTIRINDVSGVAGFLFPGDRVDVMLTRQIGADETNLATDIILQNIIILGIDQETTDTRNMPAVARTATVEVDPEQSQKLALAQQIGTLSLALRPVQSAEQVTSRRVSAADLGGPVGIETEAAPAPEITVRVRRGGKPAMSERVLR